MNKFKRNERIGAIVKILSDNPNKIFTLSFFTSQFNAAKSTISEDLIVVKNVFEKLQLGSIYQRHQRKKTKSSFISYATG